MRRHLDAAGTVVASGAVLLALVERGVMRQEAYAWVQRCALPSERVAGGDFSSSLKIDPDVRRHLDEAVIDELCSVGMQLQHVDRIFRRVLA
jgi:adenylosuccinate lyase